MSTTEKDILHEQVRNVKLRLRGVMNGITSTSMREKGLAYKVNFGVELPRLREMAEELPHTYALAAEHPEHGSRCFCSHADAHRSL